MVVHLGHGHARIYPECAVPGEADIGMTLPASSGSARSQANAVAKALRRKQRDHRGPSSGISKSRSQQLVRNRRRGPGRDLSQKNLWPLPKWVFFRGVISDADNSCGCVGGDSPKKLLARAVRCFRDGRPCLPTIVGAGYHYITFRAKAVYETVVNAPGLAAVVNQKRGYGFAVTFQAVGVLRVEHIAHRNIANEGYKDRSFLRGHQ